MKLKISSGVPYRVNEDFTGFMNKYMIKFKDKAQTKNLRIVEDEGYTNMIILMEDYD